MRPLSNNMTIRYRNENLYCECTHTSTLNHSLMKQEINSPTLTVFTGNDNSPKKKTEQLSIHIKKLNYRCREGKKLLVSEQDSIKNVSGLTGLIPGIGDFHRSQLKE